MRPSSGPRRLPRKANSNMFPIMIYETDIRSPARGATCTCTCTRFAWIRVC